MDSSEVRACERIEVTDTRSGPRPSGPGAGQDHPCGSRRTALVVPFPGSPVSAMIEQCL